MKKYLKLMRVHHYLKNLLVFTALACSGTLFQRERLLPSLLGFLAFCALSSAVYIVNDIRDCEKDKQHPTKKNRPIAGGSVSVKNAWVLAGVLLCITIVCNLVIFKPLPTILLAVYLLLNIGYSFGLKNVPIVDIAILASGFILRVVYGASIADIEISNWLYLTILALACFFALGKRRNELEQVQNGTTRHVLRYYTKSFLDKNMYLCLALGNVFYALWSMDANTVAVYGKSTLIFSVPVVLLITMRYSMDVEGDSDGDPVEVLLHDKVLVLMCLLYGAMMFSFLYLKRWLW